MAMIITRVILYVRNVDLLKNFYQTYFEIPVVEEIPGEWVVLKAGGGELALHLAGRQYRRDEWSGATGGEQEDIDDEHRHDGPASNAKLVFTITSGLPELRETLLGSGVKMRNLKRYPGFAQLMCDGEDPEGNIFQLSQPD